MAQLQASLQGHLCPTNFATSERARFHTLIRRPGETMRSFLLRLQQQATKCAFGNDLQTQLRDRIVVGVSDAEVQKLLLQEAQLTFQSAKRILENWDDIQKAITQNTDISQEKETEVYYQKSSALGNQAKNRSNHFKTTSKIGTSNQRKAPLPPAAPQSSHKIGLCNSCGGNHLRKTCGFRQAECHTCHKMGHIAKVCRQAKHAVQTVNVATSDDSDVDIQVFSIPSKVGQHIQHLVTFENGQRRNFVIDTGSPISFMPISEFRGLGFHDSDLQPTTTTIKGVSGHSLTVMGQRRMLLRDTSSSRATVNLIITENGPMVLGLDGLRALKVEVSLYLTNSTEGSLPRNITDLIHQCNNHTGGIYIKPIELETTAEPIFMKARPIAYGLRAAVEQNLQTLVNQGIIQKVTSSAWATPIVTPLKANGTPRVCGDFRRLQFSVQRWINILLLQIDKVFQITALKHVLFDVCVNAHTIFKVES